MNILRTIAVAMLATSAISVAAPVLAQNKSTDIPAEFPAASYKARQYIDSRGCVYVRAGIDGSVTWVPRVTRDRNHICNAKPTVAQARSSEPRVVTGEIRKAAPAPVVITPTPARTAAVVKQPPVVRRTTTRVAAAPAPVVIRRAAQPAPAPVTVVRTAPAPVVVPSAQPQRTAKVNGCEGASPVSNKYFNTNGLPGRCGPQAVPHITVVSKGGSARARVVTDVNGQAYGQYAPVNTVPGNARVLPRHVYETRDNTVTGQAPAGYTQAWKDGRLNPYRANQTLNGRNQMLLVWTNTVPRRLINKRTGQDVSAYHPKLIFPFTNYDSQNAYLSSQSRTQTKASVTPRVSSKSAPSRPAQAAIKGTFVQVGMYGNEANARNAVARLRNAGLPVKYGLTKRNGKQYRAVLAGPFTSRQSLNQALGSARRIGFNDAFIR